MFGNTRKGFTIIEVAIVVVCGGLFLAAGMALLHSYLLQNEINATQSRMQEIENAINTYYNVNGRLPCVASLTAAVDTATFGKEIGPDCHSAAVAGQTFLVSGVSVGTVPVRNLNLPDQDMKDAWNDRFIYAVTADLASTTIGYLAGNGKIAVKDSGGNDVALPAGTAQYVLISLGKDRVGAYADGAAPGIACKPGITETKNCTFPPASPVTFTKSSLLGTDYDDYLDYYISLGNTGTVPSGTIMIFDSVTGCPAGWNTPLGGPGPYGTLPTLGAGVMYCEKQ